MAPLFCRTLVTNSSPAPNVTCGSRSHPIPEGEQTHAPSQIRRHPRPLLSRLRHSGPLTPSARSHDTEVVTARACTVRSIAVIPPIFVDWIRCVNITVDASDVQCTSVEPRQRQGLYLVNSRRTSTATASASPTDAAYPSIQVWVAAPAGTVHPGGRSSIRQR
jgi:hypothetical protein